eukprot:CAMPEP_0177674598 /NCGR_PEP_ID=MMETSP0447-20121125/26661_1 /TAXON_ID=0 /ORGANISM="Stygamoeba regulata, Strain BSH-02190019" /LENGTH=142 /DNA_ID=CAMNT_0019182745 /DNA_START=32 /DNA_END=457 /DNA_ORIENTATION=-
MAPTKKRPVVKRKRTDKRGLCWLPPNQLELESLVSQDHSEQHGSLEDARGGGILSAASLASDLRTFRTQTEHQLQSLSGEHQVHAVQALLRSYTELQAVMGSLQMDQLQMATLREQHHQQMSSAQNQYQHEILAARRRYEAR